jgi:hypothetical protein
VRSRARDHPGRPQRLQMLGGVGRRLPAGAGELLDAARSLRQQIEQLESHRAGERLAHQRDRLEQRVLPRPAAHHCCINKSLD